MSIYRPRDNPVDPRKVQRFSYSVLAFVYQNYFTEHPLPKGLVMNFIIPDSADYVKEVGEYLNLVNAQQTSALRPLVKQVAEVLQHTEVAFIAYLKWRCKQMKYDHRYRLLCMCALISHLVLHYFERNCFRFAESAADALFEVICAEDLIISEFGSPILFGGFLEFCIRTEDDHGIVQDRPSIVKEQYKDFLENFRDPPQHLLKENVCEFSEDTTDSSAEDDSKPKVSPAIMNTGSSGECPAPRASSAGSSESTTPLESTLALASTESLGASTSGTEVLVSESKMEVDPEKSDVCSLCNFDCSQYLKNFVSKFRMRYT